MKPATAPRQRLLERLDQAPPLHTEDPGRRLQSIRHHLELLLNCRLDSCRSAPELGVSDFNAAHLAGADLRNQIANAISLCINRYEPRLRHVRVNPASPEVPWQLAFHIEAEIHLAEQAQLTSFTLLLDGLQRERRVI